MDLTEKLNLMGYSKDESKQLQSVEEVILFVRTESAATLQ